MPLSKVTGSNLKNPHNKRGESSQLLRLLKVREAANDTSGRFKKHMKTLDNKQQDVGTTQIVAPRNLSGETILTIHSHH